ncbi:MAG: hypothetical protein WBX00_10875, partial [Isosphaeraceae bacterium]
MRAGARCDRHFDQPRQPPRSRYGTVSQGRPLFFGTPTRPGPGPRWEAWALHQGDQGGADPGGGH